MPDPSPIQRFRFGVFEADRATGELRRQGVRLKLSAQPFQVLLMLLERPGQLLTREEISRELWPEGTFVDSEHGVNSAVNRIREALGDTARGARYIETLARRGYRFLASVERLDVPADVPSGTLADSSPASLVRIVRAGESSSRSLLASQEELPDLSHSAVRVLFCLLQLMYLGFYVGALANLAEIEELYAVLPFAAQVFTCTLISAAVLIPVRAFALTAVLLRPPRARAKLLKLWQFLLPLDELWALSPFLLLHHMPYGLALACTALLVYSPFAQRSLILMGAGEWFVIPALVGRVDTQDRL